jgi:hypothetical protein
VDYNSKQHTSLKAAVINNRLHLQHPATTVFQCTSCSITQVDKDGNPFAIGPPTRDAALLSCTGASSSSTAQAHSSDHGSTHSTRSSNNRSSTYAGMNASQRSMTLWERVSPGMLPDTTRTPQATTAEAFADEAHLLEPVDFTHHLKRTDFAEYTECKLRHMHHIAAAAKK